MRATHTQAESVRWPATWAALDTRQRRPWPARLRPSWSKPRSATPATENTRHALRKPFFSRSLEATARLPTQALGQPKALMTVVRSSVRKMYFRLITIGFALAAGRFFETAAQQHRQAALPPQRRLSSPAAAGRVARLCGADASAIEASVRHTPA